MHYVLVLIYKIIKQINFYLFSNLWTFYAHLLFYLNNVQVGKGMSALGSFRVNVSLAGKFKIGRDFKFRNYSKYSDTGDNRPCKFLISKNGSLLIGNNVGMTSTTITCYESIIIGSNVKIGGGTTIFDTNFHSLEYHLRASKDDLIHASSSPVIIKDHVFIGTSCIIGKGVVIGSHSIVAAGSVVVKSIPDNQIWGGNPAKFIRLINPIQ